MLTQRDLDIAELEAKAKIDKLFAEWMASYLGERMPNDNRGNGVYPDNQAPANAPNPAQP